MLEARNISYSYDDDSQALKNVSLKINDGEMAAILGKNGAGKSTLFLHFNGIHEPDDGEIFIDGEKLKYNKKALIKCRQKVGIVFQNPDNQIFAPSVEEDVAFGPLNLKLPMDEVQNRVEEALKRVGMKGFEKKAPHHLSGGQKKRVAIAGVLAMNPKILILDEPTAGLDPKGRDDILDQIAELHKVRGITIVLVSHSMEDIAKYVERLIVMNHGEAVFDDEPKKVFSHYKELETMGLAAPQITYIMHALKEHGLHVDADATTVEEARDSILAVLAQANSPLLNKGGAEK